MDKNYDGLDSLIEKYEGSWTDIIKDIGISIKNPKKRIDFHIEIMGRTASDTSTIKTLQREMGYAITEMEQLDAERKKYIKKLRNKSITDKLTGLYNREFFDTILKKTVARVNRENRDASLMIADIDNLKSFNDNYGHPTGDKAIVALSDVLKNGLRESDVACRCGGDEFGIILSDTNGEGALNLAYKLNRKIDKKFKDKKWNAYDLPVSISIGVDSIRKGDSYKNLVSRVDGFLYKAKDAGRNCVFGPDGIYKFKNQFF